MKDKIYDVIIIGAGPAGASLAYFLSDRDLRVALVEKKKYADTPVRCAELVPKAFTMLYSDKIKGINKEVSHMETYIEGGLANIKGSAGYILDRDIFIDFLIKEFVKKGGEYLNAACFINASYSCPDENISFRSNDIGSAARKAGRQINLNETGNIFVSISQNGIMSCLNTKILAGADGPLSRVAQIMELMQYDEFIFQKDLSSKNNSLKCFGENSSYKEESFLKDSGRNTSCKEESFLKDSVENSSCKEESFLKDFRGSIAHGNKRMMKGFKETLRSKKYSFLTCFQENINKEKNNENNVKIFFYPFIMGGYGWVFPKNESLNVGIAVNINTLKENALKNIYQENALKNIYQKNGLKDLYQKNGLKNIYQENRLKNIYQRFKSELVKNMVIKGNEHINSTISGLIPAGGIKNSLASGRIVLIGDAAGLCNPITGAGNYNAAASAKIAAIKIKTAINTGNMEILKEAQNDISDYFKTSINHALKKRQVLEENKGGYDFESLIKKTWVSFKDYWQQR